MQLGKRASRGKAASWGKSALCGSARGKLWLLFVAVGCWLLAVGCPRKLWLLFAAFAVCQLLLFVAVGWPSPLPHACDLALGVHADSHARAYALAHCPRARCPCPPSGVEVDVTFLLHPLRRPEALQLEVPLPHIVRACQAWDLFPIDAELG